jgi:hypothetical protein
MHKAFLPQSVSDRGNNQTSVCGLRRISPSPKIKFGFTCQLETQTRRPREVCLPLPNPNGEAWRVVLLMNYCVTSLGGMPVEVDGTGIDIAYSCSQKGLSCPPGISPLTVSPRAWDRLERRTAPVQSWYLDLKLLDGYYKGHKYHHTVPISMLYALREGLALVEEEGPEKRWERHRRNHLAQNLACPSGERWAWRHRIPITVVPRHEMRRKTSRKSRAPRPKNAGSAGSG